MQAPSGWEEFPQGHGIGGRADRTAAPSAPPAPPDVVEDWNRLGGVPTVAPELEMQPWVRCGPSSLDRVLGACCWSSPPCSLMPGRCNLVHPVNVQVRSLLGALGRGTYGTLKIDLARPTCAHLLQLLLAGRLSHLFYALFSTAFQSYMRPCQGPHPRHGLHPMCIGVHWMVWFPPAHHAAGAEHAHLLQQER
jgi:hypothetical protein